MALSIDAIYQHYQQTRDVMSDADYQELFLGELSSVILPDEGVKNQFIGELIQYAKTQIQHSPSNVLRFKTLTDPFK